MKVHDYVNQRWGHAISMITSKPGDIILMMGHGLDISEGDHLEMKMQSGKIGFMEVIKISYFNNPTDMWEATVKFHSYKE